MNTRIRKIGNSLGILISREQLKTAGFGESDLLEVVAEKGAITLRSLSTVSVNLTIDEARAVADGDWSSDHGRSAQEKIRSTIKNI